MDTCVAADKARQAVEDHGIREDRSKARSGDNIQQSQSKMEELQNHELISSSDYGAEDIGGGREPKDITVDLVYSDCTRSVSQKSRQQENQDKRVDNGEPVNLNRRRDKAGIGITGESILPGQ